MLDAHEPLRSGEIDVLAHWLVVGSPGFTIGPRITRRPRALAVAAGHPLARERSVSVEALADHLVPNWAVGGLDDRLRQAILPVRTPSGRVLRTHPEPVRTVAEAASLIARGKVVHPTVQMRHFGNDQVVLVPIHDLPPIPLGLVWRTSQENARIRALARVARDLTSGRLSPR